MSLAPQDPCPLQPLGQSVLMDVFPRRQHGLVIAIFGTTNTIGPIVGPTLAGYLVLLAVTCLTTATLALFCSVLFQKTSVSIMASYLLIVALFTLPPALEYFAERFYPQSSTVEWVEWGTFVSPFSTAFALPLAADGATGDPRPAHWDVWWRFLGFYALLDLGLLAGMMRLFQSRWRVAD